MTSWFGTLFTKFGKILVSGSTFGGTQTLQNTFWYGNFCCNTISCMQTNFESTIRGPKNGLSTIFWLPYYKMGQKWRFLVKISIFGVNLPENKKYNSQANSASLSQLVILVRRAPVRFRL